MTLTDKEINKAIAEYISDPSAECVMMIQSLLAKDREVEIDTGNFANDPLYKALDDLYNRGWRDYHKEMKHDPRGAKEWGVVLDLFRRDREGREEEQWYTPDEVQRLGGFGRGWHCNVLGMAEWITKHLNIAFNKGKQIGRHDEPRFPHIEKRVISDFQSDLTARFDELKVNSSSTEYHDGVNDCRREVNR